LSEEFTHRFVAHFIRDIESEHVDAFTPVIPCD
jgi:hypothetical protein